MAQTKVMDLTEGPIMGKLIRFTVPIVLGNLLQQFYTAADRIVVGQFAADGAGALAAIGATASAINLLIGLFVGIATGTNVICANLLGAHNIKDLRKSMHTSVLVGILCGVGMLLGTRGSVSADTAAGRHRVRTSTRDRNPRILFIFHPPLQHHEQPRQPVHHSRRNGTVYGPPLPPCLLIHGQISHEFPGLAVHGKEIILPLPAGMEHPHRVQGIPYFPAMVLNGCSFCDRRDIC